MTHIFGAVVLAILFAGFLRTLLSSARQPAVRRIDPARFKIIMTNANMGDADAQVEMAFMFLKGKGVPQDHVKSEWWFERAARAGHPVGQLYMGYKNQQAGENQFAVKWFRKSADQGNAEACEVLGNCYYEGIGIERDRERAFYYYTQASNAGRSSAKRICALMLLQGDGVPQDPEAGRLEIEAAAALGDETAKNMLEAGLESFIPSIPGTPEKTIRKSSPPSEKPKKPERPEEKPSWAPEQQETSIPQTQVARQVSLQDFLAELDSLVGLKKVKRTVHDFINRIQLAQLRRKHGLPDVAPSVHLVFTGNPGTGKTTVARILGDLFRETGFLKSGHVVEVSRADLVGEYMGTTAPRVQEKVKEALDGVLFIDEAYSLMDFGDGRKGYGDEAISALLKMMEDHRDRLVVIVAGYRDEMEKFISSNPGLKSRFTHFIDFEDYSRFELADIYIRLAGKSGYGLSADAAIPLQTIVQYALNSRDVYFGNARFVRNVFEETLVELANRVAALKNPSREDVSRILREDIHAVHVKKRTIPRPGEPFTLRKIL